MLDGVMSYPDQPYLALRQDDTYNFRAYKEDLDAGRTPEKSSKARAGDSYDLLIGTIIDPDGQTTMAEGTKVIDLGVAGLLVAKGPVPLEAAVGGAEVAPVDARGDVGAVVPPPLAVGGHAQETAEGVGDGTTGVVAAVVEAAATEKTVQETAEGMDAGLLETAAAKEAAQETAEGMDGENTGEEEKALGGGKAGGSDEDDSGGHELTHSDLEEYCAKMGESSSDEENSSG